MGLFDLFGRKRPRPQPTPSGYIDTSVYDPHRSRKVPLRIFGAKNTVSPAPVFLFSHGGSGSENGYKRFDHIGYELSNNGYTSIHVGHNEPPTGEQQLVIRQLDVTFVINEILATPLLQKNKIAAPDPDRIAHGGHSFGAFASVMLGGCMSRKVVKDTSDNLLKCLVLLSPQGPEQMGLYYESESNNSWISCHLPTISIVGSKEINKEADGKDYSDKYDQWRLYPYYHFSKNGSLDTMHYASIVAGADHNDIGGSGTDNTKKYIAENIRRFLDERFKGITVPPIPGQVNIGLVPGTKVSYR